MKAMILAAGVGSRLDPLTRNLPKPMVPVLNKPVMEHIIELLNKYGITDIMVNLHHLADAIENYFGDGSKWGVNIRYSKEETLLGDAGGVKKAEDFFADDTFLVIGGDDLSDIDLSRFIRYHKEKRAIATIALSLVDDPSEYGLALINDRGRVTKFIEKPKGEVIYANTVNAGIYLFEPQVLELIPKGAVYGFGRNLFPLLLSLKKPLYGYLSSDYWCDIGNIREYRQAHYDAMNGKVSLTMPFGELRKYVWQGEGVEIDPESEIGYPVVIGNNCKIKKGAKVLEYSVLGDDCIVEEGAKVRESILWDNVTVQEKTVLEGCVVGSKCQVKSNAAIFNGIIVSPRE